MLRKLLFCCGVAVGLCTYAFSSCTSPQNPIEAENCNPGSSGWTVGTPDTTIQGFATDISFNVGQTVGFKINTSATNYRIDVYRLGYYQGNGARLIASVTPSAQLPQSQPACLTDTVTRLVDCGNWAVSASWTIPASAVSGIYVADLVRSDTGGANQIFFIVRNDASHSDILFQTSDETWHAYNGYGGHSLYGPATGFDLTNRGYKVSYNRPFAWIESQSQPLYAEYPMVRWLEANGYDITYYSSVDAARSGGLIKNHKLYLSVGHDEYVSGPKRASVEAALEAGVNLAFFSGNEFFWKTRWENSIDGSNTPYRTLVCYKETLGATSNPAANAQVDPQDPPTWTGTWRDPTKSPPADGGRPENALTGQLFRVNGPGTDNTNLSIKIPAAEGKMRFWRNTQVAAQSTGQTWSLPAASLGYEWDSEEDNGSRPAGLIDLSTATYNLTSDYLQDFGGLYGAGVATHHMSLYRAPSGALVFGAGTIQWSWGLDSSSGGTVDLNMQQATVNLFTDMGVQPASLASNLLLGTKSTDTTPPASQISSPANGTTVRVGTNISITGTAADAGGGVVGGVEVSVDGGSTWHPASGLANWNYGWTPTISGFYTIQSRAVDDSGNIEVPALGNTVSATTSAQSLTSLTLNSSSVVAGGSVQGTVTLGQPAGAGGVIVTLSSSNPNVASVPSGVTVPAGQFSANFTVAALSVTVPTSITISGTYVATSTATLTVKQALPPPPGNVAIDAIVATDQTAFSTSVTSPTFSTAVPNELVLALVSTDANSPNATVTSVAGGGLAWTLAVRTNTQMGTAEIWRAFAPNSLSNATVTANLSQSVVSSMMVLSFAGVDTSGTNGSGAVAITGTGNAPSGAPTASLTTSRNNSMVLGVGFDWDSAAARTLGPNQLMLHQFLRTNGGDAYWMQMQNAAVPLTGTLVTINDTAPTADRYDLSIVEVRPAPAGNLTISGTITPSATGNGTQLTLSGSANSTTVANSSGAYSFANLSNGSYTVTPSKTGAVFSPSSQLITLNGAGNNTVNFSAASLQSITVSPSNPAVQAGASQAFVATGNFSDGSKQDISSQVSWSSSNNAVATINSAGVASTIAGGTSMITATLGSVSGNTILTVQATALVVTTTSLPSALQNQAYSVSVNASGGTAPYTWSLANNSVLPAGLSLSPGGTISGVPSVAGTVSFTVKVTDSGSPQQTATQTLSIAVAAAPSFFTIWNPTAAPVIGDQGPDGSVELGLKFKSDSAGTIKGIRFYKSIANTGTHIGNLWSSAGSLLGSITFSGETASGWQEADFATPIAITAGNVYVASYHAPVGHYAEDQNYFASTGTDAPPLHALQDGISGFNGAYIYGTSSAFPTQGFNASNYWVDVVFVPTAPLTSIQVTPANPTITSGNTQQFVATGTYSDGSTQNLTNQVTWASSNAAAASINAAGLASGVGPGTATISATQGSISGSTNLTVQPAPLVISTASLPNGAQNQPYAASFSASGGTPPYAWSLTTSSSLPPGLNLSASGQISGTPTAAGSTTFSVQVTDSGAPVQSQNKSFILTIASQLWSISGSLTTTGAGATVALSGAATLSTTADSSGAYSFTGLTNGTYTITPTKSGVTFNPSSQTVTITNSNLSNINFVVSSVTRLLIDANVSTDGASPSTTVTSPTFSTTAGTELLLAFIEGDYLSGTNTTVSGVTGGGLTWKLVKRTNVQSGTAEIWCALASSVLTNVSVQATLSQSVVSSITVISVTGVDTTVGTTLPNAIGATGTGNAATGAPVASLVTTRNNSWVFGVGNDYDNAIARVPGSAQGIVHQYLTPTGDTYWVQMQNSPTPTSGTSVSINDTAPTSDRFNLTTVEVRTP